MILRYLFCIYTLNLPGLSLARAKPYLYNIITLMVTLHHSNCKVEYIQQIIINETLIQIFNLGSIELRIFELQSRCCPIAN